MSIEMTCECCKQPFYCYPSEAEKGRKYCSLTCRSRHRANKELPAASRTPVNFVCRECCKPFVMMQSYLTAYRKKFSRDPLYCSMTCSKEGRRKDGDENNKFTCLQCGKTQHRVRTNQGRIYRQQKFCSYACKVAHQMVVAQKRFEDGGYKRHIKRNGYVWLTIPALSRSNGKKYIMEHRWVMSKHLGRDLFAGETVHHVNGNRQDNRLENLELFSSRHGPGQRVVDKIAFAIEMLTLYPEFAKAAGVKLVHINDDSSLESQPAHPAPSCRSTRPTLPSSGSTPGGLFGPPRAAP